ncbi:MAG: hypothetical protein RLY31_1282 [Bacteroidota bacterium]|jgi:endonuclease/exonuclease/phosphatase family metal-dependent hydrolase
MRATNDRSRSARPGAGPGRFLRTLNLLLILLTLAAYAAPTVNPATSWHFSFLALSLPFLLVGNLFFFVFWLLGRHLFGVFSAVCLLVGYPYCLDLFVFHGATDPTENDKTVTLMTYNLAGLKKMNGRREDKPAALLAGFRPFLDRHNRPDIFCVQEGSHPDVLYILSRAFGYQHAHRYKGTMILTDFPMLDKGHVAFRSSANSCAWADLLTPLGRVRVYAAHLESNALSHTADKIATQGDLSERQTWRDIRFVMRQYRKAVAVRAKQAETLAAHMAGCPYRVLLCGDLNDPPASYVYRQLAAGRKDTFRERGFGTGATFNGRLPALRIDYVLVNRQFEVLDHQVVRQTTFSDHFPVWTMITRSP